MKAIQPKIAGLGARRPQALKKRPPLPDFSEIAEDPCAEVDYSQDAEQASVAELDAVQAGFRERAKNEAKRFEEETDSEHWFAVTFENRSQKLAFLTAMGWDQADPGADKYLDGRALADHEGIDLPQSTRRYNWQEDKKLAALARPLKKK